MMTTEKEIGKGKIRKIRFNIIELKHEKKGFFKTNLMNIKE